MFEQRKINKNYVLKCETEGSEFEMIVQNMLISVIVPIYNTAEYLPTCLDSIINQTYRNIEIILVDDGSTDGSLEVCMDYAKLDPRIIVLSGSHRGVIPAKKLGGEKATGVYCIFVDSDDWIEERLLETVLPLSEEGCTDVVCYNMKSVDGNKVMEWRNTLPEGMYEGQRLETFWERMMFDFNEGRPGVIQASVTKLIKREILCPSIEAVDERITMGEDAAVVYRAMLYAKKIAITNQCLYYYRTRFSSICHTKDEEILTRIGVFQQYMQSVFAGCSSKYKLDKQLQAYMLLLLKKGLLDAYSLQFRDLYHITVPLTELGRRIVIYGAGNVGKSFYKQLVWREDIEIIAWVDKGLANQYVYGCKIESPDILNNLTFDKLLIAINDQSVAWEIRDRLSGFVSEKQIVWSKPHVNWWEMEIDI